MMDQVEEAITDFFNRYPSASNIGRVTEPREFDALPRKARNLIPVWYKSLMLRFPIAGLKVGIPFDYGSESLIGKPHDQLPLTTFIFHDAAKIAEYCLNYFPGYALSRDRFFAIARQDEGSEDDVFLSAKGQNPQPYVVFHEAGDTTVELLEDAWKPSESLSGFFEMAKLPNACIELTDANRSVASFKIDALFQELTREYEALLSGSNAPEIDKVIFEQRIGQFLQAWPERPLHALRFLDWALADSGYPISQYHIDSFIEICEIARLHIPDLAVARKSNRY